jgi:hypothetical protein
MCCVAVFAHLSLFRGVCASVSDCVHGDCHLIGGVERVGYLRVFRGGCASVSDCVHGDCHLICGVERGGLFESIQR